MSSIATRQRSSRTGAPRISRGSPPAVCTNTWSSGRSRTSWRSPDAIVWDEFQAGLWCFCGRKGPLTLYGERAYYPRMREWVRLRFLLCVAVLASGTASLAFAQRHEHKRAERAEILQLEQQWRQAELAEN